MNQGQISSLSMLLVKVVIETRVKELYNMCICTVSILIYTK